MQYILLCYNSLYSAVIYIVLLLQQLSNHCFTVTDNEELIQNIWIDQCDYGYLHGGGIEDDVFTKKTWCHSSMAGSSDTSSEL